MGNKDTTKIKQEVSNKINTEIQNITSNINKVLNETCTSTISNMINESASTAIVAVGGGNKMDLGNLNLEGDAEVDIQQQNEINATQKAIISLIENTEQMSQMANQMSQEMANKLQNDNAMKAALAAASKLKETETDAGGPEAMVNKIMDSIAKMVSIGGKTEKDIETSIRNEINMKIVNNTLNDNEIKNIVKNHVENNITKVNKQSCDMQVSGDNILIIQELDASGNAKLKITQQVLIAVFTECIIAKIDNTKLVSDITGLQTTKTSSDTLNKSKQEADMKAETEITKATEKKSAIMESVDNLVNKAVDLGNNFLAGGTLIIVIGIIGVIVALVFFLKSPEAMNMAKDGMKKIKGGGLNNPYRIVIILFLILLFTYKSKNKL